MKINKNVQLMFTRFAADFLQIAQVVNVVLLGTGVFNSLPGGEQTQAVKAPCLDSAQVLIGLTE